MAAATGSARDTRAGGKGVAMDFSLFLSCYYPDTSYPAEKMYAGMLEEAKLAEACGYCGVTVPEHHFMNILMNPSPSMMSASRCSRAGFVGRVSVAEGRGQSRASPRSSLKARWTTPKVGPIVPNSRRR